MSQNLEAQEVSNRFLRMKKVEEKPGEEWALPGGGLLAVKAGALAGFAVRMPPEFSLLLEPREMKLRGQGVPEVLPIVLKGELPDPLRPGGCSPL